MPYRPKLYRQTARVLRRGALATSITLLTGPLSACTSEERSFEAQPGGAMGISLLRKEQWAEERIPRLRAAHVHAGSISMIVSDPPFDHIVAPVSAAALARLTTAPSLPRAIPVEGWLLAVNDDSSVVLTDSAGRSTFVVRADGTKRRLHISTIESVSAVSIHGGALFTLSVGDSARVALHSPLTGRWSEWQPMPPLSVSRRSDGLQGRSNGVRSETFAANTTAVVQMVGGRDRLYYWRTIGRYDSIYIPALRRTVTRRAKSAAVELAADPVFLGTLNDSIAVAVHRAQAPVKGSGGAQHFVSLVDFRRYRVCLDLPLREPGDIPLIFSLRGDTLIGVGPKSGSSSNRARQVWLWRVTASDCPWNFIQGKL